MKCNCAECRGNGTIPCPECDGKGTYEGSIEKITLVKTMECYQELLELQKDAKRVARQAERLTQLNPARAESYCEQLNGCLFVINGQAEKLTKRK